LLKIVVVGIRIQCFMTVARYIDIVAALE